MLTLFLKKGFPAILTFLLGAFVYASTVTAQDRPNVIVILSDDQGWGDLSVTGNSNLSTPNIDSLAEDGAFFDRFYNKFDGEELEQRHRNPDRENVAKTRAALAMCENIDWNVGRILERLEELEIADETIVVYFSDNGPNGWRWNDGMKGRKGSVNEGGIRVPCLVRWPDAIPAGKEIPQIAGAIDLLPTLADLAGISVNNENPLDGTSLAPLLTGNPSNWRDRKIFSHWRGRVSVRTQRYRLDHQGRLYDMVADPGQHQDVASEHPEIAKRLSKAVADWKENVLSQLERRDRPFTVGYPEMPMTRLPARDGVAHGEIERSNRFPNCSFFRNWKTTDGRITWVRLELLEK